MYGITKSDVKFYTKKLAYQENYMSNTSFTTPPGQEKTLLEVSMSANHSPRYYAEVTNKINTMATIMLTQFEYIPIFITITLDGFFRDFLKGDYRRYNKNKAKYEPLIPNKGNLYIKVRKWTRILNIV